MYFNHASCLIPSPLFLPCLFSLCSFRSVSSVAFWSVSVRVYSALYALPLVYILLYLSSSNVHFGPANLARIARLGYWTVSTQISRLVILPAGTNLPGKSPLNTSPWPPRGNQDKIIPTLFSRAVASPVGGVIDRHSRMRPEQPALVVRSHSIPSVRRRHVESVGPKPSGQSRRVASVGLSP